ncbi:MAG TPA: DMT family transporter, partial [Candidatus Norongarragalinales archaeon]|nr:DMT family transporter [Candidatus Norongarragalinales archaeon]
GIALSTASAGAVLINVNPALVALFGVAFFGHRISQKQGIGIILATVGALAIAAFSANTGLSNPDAFVGNVLLIGSAACIALAALYSVPLSKSLGGVVGQFWGLLPGVLIFGIIWIFSNPMAELSRITFWDWLGFAWVGVVVTGICWSIMFEALNKVGAIEASAYKNLVPAFSVLLAWTFLSEPIGPAFLAFFALCLIGVFLAAPSAKRVETAGP